MRALEEIHAVRVVPVHVGDNYVGDIFRLEPCMGDGLAGLDKIGDLPLAEELLAVEPGIHQNRVAVAADQPDHHRDVHLPIFIGPRNQPGDAEVGNRSVLYRKHFVLRLGLREGCGGEEREEQESHAGSLHELERFLLAEHLMQFGVVLYISNDRYVTGGAVCG